MSPAPSGTNAAPSGAPSPSAAPSPSGASSGAPILTGSSPEPSPSGAASSPGPTGSPAPPAAPDSASLIAAAEAAGTIDHDTALLYELYAALDYPSLPPAYQSTNPAAPEATTVLAELSARFAKLSPDLQAKVAPFFMRPDDPGSIWAKRRTALRPATGSIALAGYTADTDCTTGAIFQCRDAGNTPIRLWFEAGSADGEAQAVALAAEIQSSRMWTKEQIAMLGHTPCSDGKMTANGGNSLLDVYLVSTNDFAFDGRSDTINRGTVDGVTPTVILTDEGIQEPGRR